jgi:nucleotidyltransferase substrate binding protein (TIGR01987 family)
LKAAKQLQADLQMAVRRLTEALQAKPSDLQIDAAIQRFEFAYELAWKTFQGIGLEEGQVITTPKDALKLAMDKKWIVKEDLWVSMRRHRNLASHTYSQELAKEVFQKLPEYRDELERISRLSLGV